MENLHPAQKRLNMGYLLTVSDKKPISMLTNDFFKSAKSCNTLLYHVISYYIIITVDACFEFLNLSSSNSASLIS